VIRFQQSFYLGCKLVCKGVGVILSQKDGKKECVIAYVNKGLSPVQKRFHPMEGGCYALIWGIMHFCQFICRNHCTLKIDHKSLEWLTIVFDAYGQRGRWIDMLQDFNFKILYRSRFKHMNANVLSRNLVNKAKEDENFSQEI
jgi:hypothetical protein